MHTIMDSSMCPESLLQLMHIWVSLAYKNLHLSIPQGVCSCGVHCIVYWSCKLLCSWCQQGTSLRLPYPLLASEEATDWSHQHWWPRTGMYNYNLNSPHLGAIQCIYHTHFFSIYGITGPVRTTIMVFSGQRLTRPLLVETFYHFEFSSVHSSRC